MPRTLIAGCGFLGTALGLELSARGHEVWGLRRNAAGLPSPIRPLSVDLGAKHSALRLPAEMDYVVYCVGTDDRTEESYRRAYQIGFAVIAETLSHQQAPPRRIVFTSSTGVYGWNDARWVDEDTAPNPRTRSGEWLLEGEAAALASGLPVLIARLSGLYGPGRRRLIDQVRDGVATCIDGPPRYTNRIHRDDAAAAIAHLLAAAETSSLVLLSDSEASEKCEVLCWLADRMGVAPPKHVTPGTTRDDETNKRCRNQRLLETGFALRYPSFREGYRQVLTGMGLLIRPESN